MHPISKTLALVAALALGTHASAGASDLVAPGATLEKLATGFKFTEGPASDAEGNVYFTDQPNNRIHRYGVDGELTTFLEPSGRSNGLCFDAAGQLIACADGANEMWSIAPDGAVTVIIRDHEGGLLNGPNDVWVAPDGSLYFTDPLYKRSYWTRDPAGQQGVQAVYRLSADRQTLTRVADDLKQPNGIIGTPDGKMLYVADIGDGRTYAYDIAADGTLGNRRLFCAMGSDGLTLDDRGNVYLTGDGVTVFSPAGEQIHHIEVPEKWTGNVCFGGPEKNELFITASTSLYRLRMRVTGAGSQ